MTKVSTIIVQNATTGTDLEVVQSDLNGSMVVVEDRKNLNEYNLLDGLKAAIDEHLSEDCEPEIVYLVDWSKWRIAPSVVEKIVAQAEAYLLQATRPSRVV